MVYDFKKTIQSIHSKQYAPVYLIDGEEPYYLDLITALVEENVLQPAERDFNLSVIYGKEANWTDVVSTCRRYPMFAERQVVILKDAAQMNGLGELSGYLEHPSPTTLFLIEHRFKKVDGRGKLVKIAKDSANVIFFTSDKIKDDNVPSWVQAYGREQDFQIGSKEAEILATYLGNDLQKIANEIAKVRINVPGEKELSSELIQKYIGISREYNVFEYPEALTSGNKDKLYRMLSYFIANPKSAPIPLLIGTFYGHFERMYISQFVRGKSDKEIASLLNLKTPWAAKAYMQPSRFSLQQIEAGIVLLADYSGKAVGIKSTIKDGELLKEMTAKMELILG